MILSLPLPDLQREVCIIRSNISNDHRVSAVTGKRVFIGRTVIFNKSDLFAITCLDHEGAHGVAGGDAAGRGRKATVDLGPDAGGDLLAS